MTREQTQELLLTIDTLYPNFQVKDKTLAVNAWFWALKDYPAAGIKAALEIYIKTNNGPFPPSAAQLIGCYHAPQDNDKMSEGEAWALVKKAIRDGCYHSEEQFAELPEDIQRAVGGAAMIQQWAMCDSDEINTVVMSNFQRSYKAIQAKQGFSEKVPPQLMEIINNTPRLEGT